ncbi:MAG: NEW3 domain-containing protein [Candidatus Bathyarchaeia archaeon]|jgi:uncharacterized membrane protein
MDTLKTSRKTGSEPKKVFVTLLLCSAIIIGLFPITSITYGQSTTGYVYGYALDVNGAYLSAVTVELKSGSITIASTYTNLNGFYLFESVPFGTYTLRLAKNGYDDVVQTLSVQSVDKNMGNIVMPNSLKLSTSLLSIIADPGDTVTVPITVRNTGAVSEVVDLSTLKPSGWNTRILFQGYEVAKLRIDSGQSMSLQLDVAIPSGAPLGVEYDISLVVAGITESSLTFSLLTRAQPMAIASGRVVDIQGTPISGVTVASSLGGSLLQSSVTGVDGTFSIDLPAGQTLSISFTKDGYSQGTKTVTMPSEGETVQLDDIVLSGPILLSSSSFSAIANPKTKTVFSFTARNDGPTTETVEFSVNAPAGWSGKILETSGGLMSQTTTEIKYLVLQPNSAVTLQLEISVPLSANGDNNITLTAEGETVSALDFMVTVQPYSDPMLFAQFTGKRSMPGEIAPFGIVLVNPFGFVTKFTFSVSSLPEGWTADVRTEDGEPVVELVLAPEGSISLVVDVLSPTSATTGTNYEITVNALSECQIVSSLPLFVSLVEPEYVEEIVLTTKYPEVTVQAGKSFQYPITLENNGLASRLVLLYVEPPADWKVVFKSGDSEISQLNMDPESVEELIVEVTPPSTVSLDIYSMPLRIMSENGDILAETELKSTITGSFDLRLSLSTLLSSTVSGESTSFTASVINTGYSTQTVIGLKYEAPEGWEVKITPSQVDVLRPQEPTTFNVEIKTPSDTVAGDYIVTLRGFSDQFESLPSQLRVSINASTSWGIFGFGIAIVIIVLLVLVFRKFKRR